MCQENYITENKKFKSLEEFEHGIIQNSLDNNEKTGVIAEKINRDSSTIKKAVSRYSIKTCANPKCSQCLKYKTCEKRKLCEIGKTSDCGACKNCELAIINCGEYDPLIECKFLKGHKKVCNGCFNYKQCRKPKLVYKAEAAIKIHNQNKKNSQKTAKIDKISEAEFKTYDEYVSTLIKKQISVAVVLATLPEEIKRILKVSIKTLYNYINESILSCRNIDLLNKLKRKEKSEIKRQPNRSKNRANGRSVHDITEEQLKLEKTFEMDTVEGIKGGKLLLTIITRKQHFMFGLPILSKHQNNIENELNELELRMGTEKFQELFGIGITDNGSEFLDFNSLEKSIKSTEENPVKRFSIHYADPYASYQKALVENNHRIIRYMIQKGYDMSNLTNEEILSIMNRVNNYPRKSLDYSTPYLEMLKVLDENILKKLGFHYISIENLDMKSKKVA